MTARARVQALRPRSARRGPMALQCRRIVGVLWWGVARAERERGDDDALTHTHACNQNVLEERSGTRAVAMAQGVNQLACSEK